MPYLFGGLVVLNAVMLSYYLFLKPPERSKSVQQVHKSLTQPIEFSNSAAYLPPPIGTKK